MNLNLKRPLVFFDLETTGLNITRDKIVEICILKLFPDNDVPFERVYRVKPVDNNGNVVHISPEASKVHHITDADVANERSFKEIAKEIYDIFEGCDIAGFNSNKFDIPLLAEEFSNVGYDFNVRNRRFIDVQTIYHKMEPRNLSAAYLFYCNKSLVDAHSAAADTRATFEILKAQLDRYPNLENDVQKLSDFSSHNRQLDLAGRIVRNEQGVPVFNFGKYKGQSVEEVLLRDSGYYGWLTDPSRDFPNDTKQVIREIYLSIKNKSSNSNFVIKPR